MSLLSDFKNFALKGNAFDLAIGVIIGGAFGRIVTSLVNDIILPPIGFLLGGVDFKNLEWILKDSGDKVPAISIKYGMFLQVIFDFTIVAVIVFLLVRFLTKLKNIVLKEETQISIPQPSASETLLSEIRDELKQLRVISLSNSQKLNS